MKGRNGKIDFLRFLFALFIMFLHFGYRPQFTILGETLILGNLGSFGVNFFFAVSGFLLAKSVEKLWMTNEGTMFEQYPKFLLKKYSYYMQWYLPAFVSTVILDVVSRENLGRGLEGIISSIPNLLLMGSLGFSDDSSTIGYYVGASWFVSALFCVQILIFPLMRYNYRLWSRVLQPIIFIIGLSLMVNGHSDRILRALVPMILGGIGYETAKIVSECDISKNKTMLLKVLEILVYIYCFAYMCSDSDPDTQYGMMILVSIGVMLSFCSHTYNNFFDHPIFSFLGKISFPLYLLHIQVLHWSDYIIEKNGLSIDDRVKYPILYLVAIIIAIFAYMISDKIKILKSNQAIR